MLAFVILDLFQILIISSIDLKQSEKTYSFLTLEIDVGYDIGFNFNLEVYLAFIFVIYLLRSIMGNYILTGLFKKSGIGMYQIFPSTLPLSDVVDSRIFSKVSSAKINHWVTEIAEEMKIGRISKVFLAKTAIPNAYTIELSAFPFIPFLRKRNYVVLNSNIFQILNEDEIKAVIAHELAHIKNHDSSLRLILSGPHLFLQAAYLYFYILILTGISYAILVEFKPVQAIVRAIILLVVMIWATLISDLTIGFLRKSNQMAELQADLEPLRIIGFKPTINMLIKLGQRTEVLESLKMETIWLEKQDIYRSEVRRSLIVDLLEKFPETEIDDLKVLHEVPRLYLEKMLEILSDSYYLDLTNLEGLDEQLTIASQKLFEKRNAEIETKLKTKISASKRTKRKSRRVTVDWRDFDLNLDFNLEVEEIEQFVLALQQNPSMLFKSEANEVKNDAEKNHPSFRTRVLFVYHVAEEWHSI